MSAQRPVRVIAVVPLFRPSKDQVAALELLARQVDQVVAVDDGSGPGNALDSIHPALTLIEMPVNGGIARCLNEGIRVARLSRATHVLTVDQDSRLPEGYVAQALSTLARLEEKQVAAGGVGAGMIGSHRVEGASMVDGVRDGIDGIQSGWLLPIATIDAVGPFDEGLFIDCVDVDYLMRATLAGRPIVVTDDCRLEHSLGSDEHVLHLLGRGIVFSYHPPFRRYYIVRNRVAMLRRYARARPRTMLSQSAAALRITALCLIFGRHRAAQVAAIGLGLAHGVTGRGGRVTPRVRRLLSTA